MSLINKTVEAKRKKRLSRCHKPEASEQNNKRNHPTIPMPQISPSPTTTTFAEIDDDEDPEEVQDMASLAPAVLPITFDAAAEEAINRADTRDDMALRNLVSPELLHFDWSGDSQVFKGAREKFTGNAGPTFPISELTCPLDVFFKIWDVPMIDLIVSETNKYAAATIAATGPLQQKLLLRFWKPTDRQEILLFFGIYQMHSLINFPDQKDYFKASGLFALPNLASLMSYDRFILLKRFLRFASHSPANLSIPQQRLHKIKPIIDRLTHKFMSLYKPGQSIAIDESLLLWKGRLAFAQKMSNKAAKLGIQSFELWESATGYLWNFFIYAGADKIIQTGAHTDAQTDAHLYAHIDGQIDSRTVTQSTNHLMPEPEGVTAGVIYELARPLLNLGHTLVIDNYYNSPLLARYLKLQKTDVLGTLRVNREFVPDAIKSMTKPEMRVGEIATCNTEDLAVLLWCDSNMVCMVSTFHKMVVEPKEKYSEMTFKPRAVHDYNLLMGGVDKKDRLLSAYPMERTRNQVWYKKLFLRLLNVSILNCYVIYKCKFNIDHRSFRKNLAEALIACSRPSLPASVPVQVKTVRTIRMKHNERPVLKGNHYIAKGRSKDSACVWCRMEKRKRARSQYFCERCDVSLCFSCFRGYHS